MLPIHFRFRETDIIYSPMRFSTFFGTSVLSHGRASKIDFKPVMRAKHAVAPHAGVLGVCSTAYAGATLVIPPRFSTHRFWDDVIQSRATIIHVRG